jgi:hypothetical protein
MISFVAPLGGPTIGKAVSREDAWWLCRRYGLKPLPLNDASNVNLEENTVSGEKVWLVRCEHTQFPYDRGAFENRRRDRLATLENGLPAWPVAEENGIAFQTFRQRLKRGWSGERAATEGVREVVHDPDYEWEAIALKNGLTVRAYRSRVQAGCPVAIAATMGLSWRQW